MRSQASQKLDALISQRKQVHTMKHVRRKQSEQRKREKYNLRRSVRNALKAAASIIAREQRAQRPRKPHKSREKFTDTAKNTTMAKVIQMPVRKRDLKREENKAKFMQTDKPSSSPQFGRVGPVIVPNYAADGKKTPIQRPPAQYSNTSPYGIAKEVFENPEWYP